MSTFTSLVARPELVGALGSREAMSTFTSLVARPELVGALGSREAMSTFTSGYRAAQS